MVNSWWLIIEFAVWAVVCIFMQRMAYRHGIWDGAFNHFLPIVKREMYYYDEHRAKKILEDEAS